MSGPKHAPYPEWVEEAVRDHYDRIAEGVEDKPHVGIADMLWDAYERGQREAAPRLAAALKGLIADIEALMEDTEGVETTDDDGPYTMSWARLLPGGKYEYLTHWNAARTALREAGVTDDA